MITKPVVDMIVKLWVAILKGSTLSCTNEYLSLPTVKLVMVMVMTGSGKTSFIESVTGIAPTKENSASLKSVI
jgi:energy-coupling factor transporter ATP-binding protein EcfA2